MPTFKAKLIDLDLDLYNYAGVNTKIKGPEIKSGVKAGDIAARINVEDKNFDERPDDQRTMVAVSKHVSRQLSELYGEEEYPADWWVENFDPTTLNEIKLYIVQSLLGAKKRGSDSGK